MLTGFGKIVGAATLIAALAVGSGPANAQFIGNGQVNQFEDNSREAFFDTGATNPGTFGVGDVVVGYVRIDQRVAPGATVVFPDTLYAVFSQQVTSIVGTSVQFGTTSVVGLRMGDITGGTASNSSMVALYTNPAGYGALTGSTLPPNQVGGAAITMADYTRFISGGSFLLSAGIVDLTAVTGDFFSATLKSVAPPSTAVIGAAGGGINFASFSAGLSLLQNNTGLAFLDTILTNGEGANLSLVQLAIVGGNVVGAEDVTTQNFQDGSEFGAFAQCGTTGGCGFINNADFLVQPLAVPEPASMILFGLGLAGLGAYGRRRNRK